MSRLPNYHIRSLASSYLASVGIPNRLNHRYVKIDESSAIAIADAFESAAHQPEDPLTLSCYEKFCIETERQWDFIRRSGFVVVPWLKPGQPYKNSKAMMDDVRRGRLSFFLTSYSHGENDELDQSNNPLMSPTNVRLLNQRLCVNDLFRIVHDVFGHAAGGFGFGARGEENAWLSHRLMYSKQARRAMTTETRGQNSWVNFGPHLRNAQGKLYKKTEIGYVATISRPYAKQKMTLLPSWVSQPMEL